MKKSLIVIISIVAVLAAFSFIKDLVIKTSVEKGVEIVTGLPLKIQSLKVGIMKTFAGIKGLTLYNPKGYPDKEMLNMPEIYVDYNLPDIIKGKVHLEEVLIDLKQFTVIKNKNGELNLDSLKVVQDRKEDRKPAGGKDKAPEIQVDDLRLKIGKVIYKDYSKGRVPVVKEFNVNLNERYKNIRDPYSLVSLIVVKALMNTTIANLSGFDLKGLRGTISDTLAGAQKIAAETAAEAREKMEEAAERAREAREQSKKIMEDTRKTLQKSSEDLKNALKLPVIPDKK